MQRYFFLQLLFPVPNFVSASISASEPGNILSAPAPVLSSAPAPIVGLLLPLSHLLSVEGMLRLLLDNKSSDNLLSSGFQTQFPKTSGEIYIVLRIYI